MHIMRGTGAKRGSINIQKKRTMQADDGLKNVLSEACFISKKEEKRCQKTFRLNH